MNLIRQQLSRLKGGGLLRAAAPARVTALILSDVVGDDLRVIASGPTVAPIGTADQARAALAARGLWDRLPGAVRRHLESAPPPEPLPEAENLLVGSNAISVAAMAEAAPGARGGP
jgi:glycerate 2-kinase